MASEAQVVLVVEDDDDIREVMIEILTERGYTVCLARHGAEALKQLRTGPRPGIILLDLTMPVMDGWAFCREKQQDPALDPIPVLVTSAVSPRDPRNESLRAASYMTKPLDLHELLASIRRHW
jgi:CheY-like chemotaxis protein